MTNLLSPINKTAGKNYLLLASFFCLFLLMFVPPIGLCAVSDEVSGQFQELSILTRQFQNRGYNTEEIANRLDQTVALISNQQFDEAGQLLGQVEEDLKSLGRSKPLPYGERIRIEWLEVYGDIFRKFAFIILTAYFLIRLKRFRDIFTRHEPHEIRKQRLLLLFVFFTLGAVSAGLGFIRYGESDWHFLDLQLVYTTLCGLIGGSVTGGICGLLGGLFRLFLKAGNLSYFFILAGAGLIGGWIARVKVPIAPARRTALLAGLVVGTFHGLVAYAPLWRSMGFSVVNGVIFSLVALETLSVYIFVAVALGVIADQRRKKLEKLLPEMKLKFLQAQINPHFLFNALNTIAAICSREKAEQARHLIVKLSNYFRRIVKREDEWVSLEEELKHIDSYLELEKARYQDGLQIEKEVNLSKKGLHAELPILILQPIVENAIKHGLAAKSGGGLLKISAWENGENVEIQVRDDGVGIQADKLNEIRMAEAQKPQNPGSEGSGIGLRNIGERLRYQFGPGYRLQIESEIGKGTTIQFKIPLEREEEE